MTIRWQEKHREVEEGFLDFLGQDAPFVLKGGTSLMLCYGLDRFSEDLDFDAASLSAQLERYAKPFAERNGYNYYLKNNTPTTQRCTIHYGGEKPLKIEVSYRRGRIPPSTIDIVNETKVHTLETLARMKLGAYMARDRIRDLYDVAWLVNEHLDEFSPALREQFEISFAEKGLEQFEVVIDEQTDEFFDKEKLLTMFLEANERLSLRGGGAVACADRILERAGSTPTTARTPLRTDNAAVMIKSIR